MNQAVFEWGGSSQRERAFVHVIGGKNLDRQRPNEYGEWDPEVIEMWDYWEAGPDPETLEWFGLTGAGQREVITSNERRRFATRAADNLVALAPSREMLTEALDNMARSGRAASRLGQLAMDLGVDWSADSVILRDCTDGGQEDVAAVRRYASELRLGRSATLSLTVESRADDAFRAGEQLCRTSGFSGLDTRPAVVDGRLYRIVADLGDMEEQSPDVFRVVRWLFMALR